VRSAAESRPETGKMKILRFVAAQGVGRAIHELVEGQIQGRPQASAVVQSD